MSVVEIDNAIRIEVCGDGVRLGAGRSDGRCVENMRDRVEALDGELVVSEGLSGGAPIRASIPIAT